MLLRLAALAGMFALLAPDAARAVGRQVPVCTIVAVRTLDAVSSSKAKTGDFFRFASIGALQIRGKTLIPSNTVGYGIVTFASAAAKGRGGALLMEPLYFKLNGAKWGVVRARGAHGLNEQGSSNALPTYLGAIPLPGVGALVTAVNALKKGKDVTIDAGTFFAVYASNDPATARCDREKET